MSPTVLIHTIFFRPELVGVAVYTTNLSEWLARTGFDVRVVCPPPYYPQWRIVEGYRARTYTSETVNGVCVTRCPIWVPKRPSAVRRVLHEMSFALSSLPVLIRQAFRKPAIVFVIEPSFANVVVSLLIGRCCRAVTWLHVTDFEIDIACDLLGVGRGRLGYALRAFESWVMKRFDIVSTLSEPMLQRLLEKGVEKSRTFLLPDRVDLSEIQPMQGVSTLRKQLGIPEDDVIALYSGSTGDKHGVDILVSAAAQLESKSRVRFLVCGAGPNWETIRQRAKGMVNMQFLPLQPRELLNDLLNTADIHLLPQKPQVAEHVMPCKLIGMLATGRPVVAAVAANSPVARIVANCGLVVPPETPELMAKAILTLAEDRELRLQLGANARTFAVENFDERSILASTGRKISSLLKDRNIDMPSSDVSGLNARTGHS